MIQVKYLAVPTTAPWPHLAIKQPPTPQCEAQRTGTYANDTAATDKRCSHSSKFVVGGRHLCLRHAEIAALVYLLEHQP